MYRTPKVAFTNHKFNYTDRNRMQTELMQAPIKALDRDFLTDIMNGMSYKELSIKYNKSISRIAQWKRTLYDKLADYYRQNINIQ